MRGAAERSTSDGTENFAGGPKGGSVGHVEERSDGGQCGANTKRKPAENGLSHSDYIAEQYVKIGHMPKSTVAELDKHAQQQRTRFQAAVDSAIKEWATTRPKRR